MQPNLCDNNNTPHSDLRTEQLRAEAVTQIDRYWCNDIQRIRFELERKLAADYQHNGGSNHVLLKDITDLVCQIELLLTKDNGSVKAAIELSKITTELKAKNMLLKESLASLQVELADRDERIKTLTRANRENDELLQRMQTESRKVKEMLH